VEEGERGREREGGREGGIEGGREGGRELYKHRLAWICRLWISIKITPNVSTIEGLH
jgi:hypothetical protein